MRDENSSSFSMFHTEISSQFYQAQGNSCQFVAVHTEFDYLEVNCIERDQKIGFLTAL